MPQLSVIVPVYNRAKELKECLQAIRLSAFKDYELIVVDDASQDESATVAEQFADKVIRNDKNLGVAQARNSGIDQAQGEVIANIDSDIVIFPDTLSIIVQYFEQHPEVAALTGLISTQHPHRNFFSQYKNLYMNYIFSKLPDRVSFLFASVCAWRGSVDFADGPVRHAVDTELGQRLAAQGSQIAFLKDLEVKHLKHYHFFSWIKNDFHIPYEWAHIFWKHQGWRRLGKNKVGFAHSPKEQLASVILAPIILGIGFYSDISVISALLIMMWSVFNVSFLKFLFQNRGVVFGCSSIPVTFLDHLVMALGIGCGTLAYFFRIGGCIK